MRSNRRQLTAILSALAAAVTMSFPAGPALGATISQANVPADGVSFEPLPSLPVNSCNDPTLPQSFGTNFPVPDDPHGFGFANQTVIGWEGNIYAPSVTSWRSRCCGLASSAGLEGPAPGKKKWLSAG